MFGAGRETERSPCADTQRRKKKGRFDAGLPNKGLLQVFGALVNCARRIRPLLLWCSLRNDRRSDALLFESVLQHFVQCVNVGDFQIAEEFGWKIRGRVWLVVRGKQDLLHARAFCAEYFFLDAADWQDNSRERHFTGHRKAIANWSTREQAH